MKAQYFNSVILQLLYCYSISYTIYIIRYIYFIMLFNIHINDSL